MKENFDTPVVFFIFNRPDTTKLVFEEIRKLKPMKLYIFADGPRHGRNENDLCERTRETTKNIDWECQVTKIFSEINLGCQKSITSGLNLVFSKEEYAIILEDDCLPNPSFFEFCRELLIRYKDDSRVGAISGNNFQFNKLEITDSYFYSRYFNCWGWATWRRTWKKFDVNISIWPEVKSKNILKNIFPKKYEAYFWNAVFERVHNKKINSWAHPFSFCLFFNYFLTIVPAVNLVSNIGFDNRGTHTNEDSILASVPTHLIPFPLKHPSYMHRNTIADENTGKICFYTNIPFLYIKAAIKYLFGDRFFSLLTKIRDRIFS